MKIRDGFVSNSSSSSFILGLGRVTDLDKVNELKKEYGYAVRIETLKEIAESEDCWSGPTFKNDRIELECSYSGHSVTLDAKMPEDQNTHFIIVDLHNNEGDSEEGTELYDAVYEDGDLSESYFEGSQEALLNLNEEEHGVKGYTCTFGAARNG